MAFLSKVRVNISVSTSAKIKSLNDHYRLCSKCEQTDTKGTDINLRDINLYTVFKTTVTKPIHFSERNHNILCCIGRGLKIRLSLFTSIVEVLR